jgi:plasmid stability protein
MVPKWNRFGGKMATITIKNVPDELYELLRERAEINRRSINGELIYLIENTVRPVQRTTIEILAEAQQLRELTRGFYLTEEELNRAKSEGRS